MTRLKVRGRFWLVWREGGGAPTKPHKSKAGATVEALRLAGMYPGDVFFVMLARGAAYAEKAAPKLLKIRRIRLASNAPDDDIPF